MAMALSPLHAAVAENGNEVGTLWKNRVMLPQKVSF